MQMQNRIYLNLPLVHESQDAGHHPGVCVPQGDYWIAGRGQGGDHLKEQEQEQEQEQELVPY